MDPVDIQLNRAQRLFRKFWQQPPVRIAGIGFIAALLTALPAVFFNELGSTYLFVDRTNAPSDPLTRAFFMEPGEEGTVEGETSGASAQLQQTYQDELEKLPKRSSTASGVEGVECKLIEVRADQSERGDEIRPEGAGLICTDGDHKIFRIKNVGYLPALNWSLALILLFPVSLYLLFRSIREITPSLETMRRQGMFAGASFERPDGDIVAPTALAWRRAFRIGLGGFIIGFGVVLWDFYTVVDKPYSQASQLEAGKISPDDQQAREALFPPQKTRLTYEYDWSVSAVFEHVYNLHYPKLAACLKKATAQKDTVRCNTTEEIVGYANTVNSNINQIFSGSVYFLLALITGTIISYYGVMAAIGWTLESVAHDQVNSRAGLKRRFNLIVVPGLKSDDKRAGFENFSRFLTFMLWATVVNYFALYFMRLQNLYMRNHDYSSLTEFMFRDIGDPIAKLFSAIRGAGQLDGTFLSNVFGDYTGLGDLVNILDPGLNDSQAYLGIFVLLIVYAIVAISFLSATSDLSRQAKSNLRSILNSPDGPEKAARYYNLSSNEISNKLNEMNIWPVAWPNLRGLLRFLAVGIVFLVFYRIWMIWLAGFMVRFLKSDKISDAPRGDT